MGGGVRGRKQCPDNNGGSRARGWCLLSRGWNLRSCVELAALGKRGRGSVPGQRPAEALPGGTGMATPDPPQASVAGLEARPRVAQTPQDRPRDNSTCGRSKEGSCSSLSPQPGAGWPESFTWLITHCSSRGSNRSHLIPEPIQSGQGSFMPSGAQSSGEMNSEQKEMDNGPWIQRRERSSACRVEDPGDLISSAHFAFPWKSWAVSSVGPGMYLSGS